MRDQVKLTFTVGLETSVPICPDRLSVSFADDASRLCGGCTIRKDRGFWKADGAEKKDTFDGDLIEETAIVIELTCEVHKVDAVYTKMREYLKASSQGLNNAFTWVHVIREDVVGMHFDATEPMLSRAQYRDAVSPGTRLAHA